jgi:diacylglycerol O-acyltransferase
MTDVDTNRPGRVLIISASMGDGHNAAAAALTEAIEESWPGCVVERLDTMELRGPRFAKVAQWAYAFQLSVMPRTYAISYDWLSRSARSAAAVRASAGAFFGRRLHKAIVGHQPDLVISTYPFGSAAVDWLRKTKNFATAAVTYIPAFHVHPLWAYQGIDLHFVMYEGAAEHALLPGFERSQRLGAPPVRRRFGTISRDAAREMLGIPADDFVVLMTGGAWGVGGMGSGVEALVKLEPPVHVVAVCGRNVGLQAEMHALASVSSPRLTVYGYVPTMPELMSAANVVVTNGAGNTVLEALRTPRPVVAFAPLAGHGTASTVEMVKRNLAVEARDVPGLVAQVRRLRTEPGLLDGMERASRAWAAGRDLQRTVDEIETLYRTRVAERSVPFATVVPGRVG